MMEVVNGKLNDSSMMEVADDKLNEIVTMEVVNGKLNDINTIHLCGSGDHYFLTTTINGSTQSIMGTYRLLAAAEWPRYQDIAYPVYQHQNRSHYLYHHSDGGWCLVGYKPTNLDVYSGQV